MYHKSLKRNMGLSVLILVLVSLSIGYAIISSNLELNGNAKIANMAWQVYFDNVKVTDGSTGLSVPTLSADKTSVSFTTSFTKPTDYYDFTLDLINAGTIAAKVDSVVLSGLTAEQDVYANYRVTYVGGGEISAGDTLNPGETREIRVRLEMDPDVDGSLLPSTDATLALSARINFVQGEEVKYLMDVIKKEAVLDSIASTYVTSSSGIDFSAVSSDTNGKGVYTLTSSASDKYPIYYYRGAVENNNVIFGAFCWKMVRTTETGGIKLIYNGTPTDGTCVATGADTTIGTSKFNDNTIDPAYDGYMYGNEDNVTAGVSSYGRNISIESGAIFGKSYTYVNGVYTLQDTITLSDDYQNEFKTGYRYTCNSGAITCSKLYYTNYFTAKTAMYALLFKNGTLEEALESLRENQKDSVIKTVVDKWFTDNMLTSLSNLEDTVWCNYRYRLGETKNYSGNLTCAHENDRFTVYSENGNGDLTYPIALMTENEASYAGVRELLTIDKNNYLYSYNGVPYNGSYVHLMSTYGYGIPGWVGIYYIQFGGGSQPLVDKSAEVRPMVSLKVGTAYTGGTGSSSDPYVIK